MLWHLMVMAPWSIWSMSLSAMVIGPVGASPPFFAPPLAAAVSISTALLQ